MVRASPLYIQCYFVIFTKIIYLVLFALLKSVWGLSEDEYANEATLALAGIDALRAYFKSIGAPTTLTEVGIPAEALPKIAEKSNRYPTSYTNFTTEDILAIYQSAL